MSKSNPFLPRQSNNFNLKKQVMKTPHPKIYKHEEDAEGHGSSYVDINTTKDKTFIGKDSANTYDETEKIGKCRKFFTQNERQYRFSVPPKISDYFLNFEKIKRKLLSRSSDSRLRCNRSSHSPIIILNDSLMNSSSKTITRSSFSERSRSSENIYSSALGTQSKAGEKSSNYSTYGTPMFGLCSAEKELEQKENEAIHPNLPFSKKNDEIFKSKLVSKLKGNKMSTDTHKFIINRKRKCNLLN
jgi:hypothetical protein